MNWAFAQQLGVLIPQRGSSGWQTIIGRATNTVHRRQYQSSAMDELVISTHTHGVWMDGILSNLTSTSLYLNTV